MKRCVTLCCRTIIILDQSSLSEIIIPDQSSLSDNHHTGSFIIIGQSSYWISHHYRTIIIPDQSSLSDNHHTGSFIIIGQSSYRISHHYRTIIILDQSSLSENHHTGSVTIIGQSSNWIIHHYRTIIILDQSSFSDNHHNGSVIIGVLYLGYPVFDYLPAHRPPQLSFISVMKSTANCSVIKLQECSFQAVYPLNNLKYWCVFYQYV